MERVAITLAILVAIVFAAAGMGALRLDGVNFSFAGSTAPQAPVGPGELPAATYAGRALRVEHAAAVLNVIAEEREDISVAVRNPGRAPMPLLSAAGGTITIDGRLQGRILNCRPEGGADLLGYGGLTREDLPVIEVRTPRAVALSIGGAVSTTIGEAGAVDLELTGCGPTRIGDVAGELEIEHSGSGDIEAGASASAAIDLAGSSDIALGAVRDALKVDLAGSGAVSATQLTGDLEVDTAGSGDVIIAGGAIKSAEIDIAGSGAVTAAASVQSASVSIAGSGDVAFDGIVGALDAEIMGSGSVSARAVTGANRQRIMGSGEVTIGGAAPPPPPAPPAAPLAPPATPARP